MARCLSSLQVLTELPSHDTNHLCSQQRTGPNHGCKMASKGGGLMSCDKGCGRSALPANLQWSVLNLINPPLIPFPFNLPNGSHSNT